MSPKLSNRALRVDAARSSREIVTVTVLRSTEETLMRIASAREAINGGGHLHQNMGEAIDDAVAHALASGHWGRY